MASERPKVKPRVVKSIWTSAKAREKEPPKSKPPTDTAKDRLQIDLSKIDAATSIRLPLEFPNPDNILNILMTLRPGPHTIQEEEDVSYYAGGVFHFDIEIPHDYPWHPPKVRCREKIYHPNIDLQGNVCLDILRKEWTAVADLIDVMMPLEQLFVGLRAEDVEEPLNIEAGADYKASKENFRRNVRKAMAGGVVHKQTYDRVLK